MTRLNSEAESLEPEVMLARVLGVAEILSEYLELNDEWQATTAQKTQDSSPELCWIEYLQ